MLLKDRVAIVTGGAKGIGKGIALRFAEEGCNIGIADIDETEANNTVSEIQKLGRDGITQKCDTTDENQMRELIEKVASKFGKIDIMVNNAGGLPSTAPVDEMSVEEWDKVIALNLRSAFIGCKLVVPYMKEKHYGKIINVSSLGAIHAPSSNVHYHAAKAGVLGMTYDLAVGLSPYNIYVNAILPGPIRTAFFKERQNDDSYFEELGKTVPLLRVGAPRDIAGVALFLASELSDFVTGEEIKVTGGLPLAPPRTGFQKK